MPKVMLVNPSRSPVGISFITPRWLFVIAHATPTELVGDPVLVDESIEAFDPSTVEPGDIVGIGVGTVNCLPAYRVVRQAKARGAKVIVGGIHATLMPDEALDHGADSVVTGNGELVWPQIVRDALSGNLRPRYAGGRVEGGSLAKARWDLMNTSRYLFPTVQTVAGCPENCSFCSVWVSDGRRPRQRAADTVIEEVNQLHRLGYRVILLADDNFAPATLGRIAREPSAYKREEFARIREERLRFFDEYDRGVPKDIYAFSQVTSEVAGDPEYLSALFHKMRIRQALVGVESFSKAGLDSARKTWNPAGDRMVDAIRTIQDQGIVVLSSLICGLESDTVESLRQMRQLALESGSMMAQFALYNPYPGTHDYYSMIEDRKHRGTANYVPKHRTRLVVDRFWLTDTGPADVIEHPTLTREELLRENRLSWNAFYALPQIVKRSRQGVGRKWTLMARITYVIFSVMFRRVYGGNGLVADIVHKRTIGRGTKVVIAICMACWKAALAQSRASGRGRRQIA